MRIEDYIGSLPQDIMSGRQVQLTAGSLRRIFDLAGLGDGDVFYHLGCGDGLGVRMAAEYGAKRSVGIDSDGDKIGAGRGAEMVCCDVRDADISDATVVLFWFTDEEIVDAMMPKFERLGSGARVVTVWSPLPGLLPHRVDFPYIVSRAPFQPAASLRDQLLAVFGVECIDFLTAWEYSERYTKAIGPQGAQNDRFLTILQSVTMWINARNMGVSCTDEMPESIRTYVGILRTFFGIEVQHLLDGRPQG